MISDIRFGKNKKSKFAKKARFYVYHNLSETTLIGFQEDWIGIEPDIIAVLSHETIHKVIFKLEGGKASTALDAWCKSRQWLHNDDTGICFFSWEIEPHNPIYQKAKERYLERKGFFSVVSK